MSSSSSTPPNSAPDPPPHLSLDEFRRHGHALIDWIADYHETVGERPVQASVTPGEIRSQIPAQPPATGEAMTDILADLDQVVMPGITHWQHPGWFAYFPANVSPAAMLGEIAAVGLGAQGMLWSTSPALTEVEHAVMDWLVELLGLPATWRIDTGPGGGVLQMSASDSTHTALFVARHRATEKGTPIGDLVAYGSTQAHSSIEKGARVAGYQHVRAVPVDANFALDPDALASLLEADRAAGLVPAFVCSAMGTTGTTAVDPIAAVATLATEYDMWHHVDAAYAGSAMVLPELRHHQAGLERVDSYTFNPHKWLLTNFDCSAFFVADRAALIDALSIIPPYLRNDATDSGAVIDYRDWHVPLGRRFRALKLWFVLRSYGGEGLQAYIAQHLAWAQALSDRVDSHTKLVRIAPTPFGLVSFRHLDGNDATRALAAAINADGAFYVTPSVIDIDGEPTDFIRISIGTTSTTETHVEALWRFIAEELDQPS